jgi:ribosomal protein S15P/S13E
MRKKNSVEKEKKPEKVKISQEEFEKKVGELAKQGLTSEKIGERLKKEGIHSQEFNKKISEIMGDKYSSPDIININNKLEKIKKHIEKNKQDKRAIREKDRIYSQLRKIKKYFKLE